MVFFSLEIQEASYRKISWVVNLWNLSNWPNFLYSFYLLVTLFLHSFNLWMLIFPLWYSFRTLKTSLKAVINFFDAMSVLPVVFIKWKQFFRVLGMLRNCYKAYKDNIKFKPKIRQKVQKTQKIEKVASRKNI